MKPEKTNPQRHAEKIRSLVDSVLIGPGQSDPQLRQAVEQRAAAQAGQASQNEVSLPEVLDTYVDKIARHAYKITDADVDALRAAGYSEDVIFELTLSAALGAGMARFERGMAALTGEENAA